MELKSSFPRVQGLVHLNNAGLAPSSLAASTTVRYWMERFHLEGMHCNDDYMNAAEVARAQLAGLAGADATEIAFFQSTAGAISQVAFSFKLNVGDEVLLWAQEYPSNLYPWKAACDRSGAVLKLVANTPDLSTPIETLLAHVTEHTRVIALSWVQYQAGAISDLKKLSEFARARGIFTAVDVIQGLGLYPFDFRDLGIDAACGGSHKWLLSPVGVGFLILRQEYIAKFRPLTVGASTYGTCDDPSDLTCSPKDSALRFESGSKQVLEITALGASAEWLSRIGVEHIAPESERLASRLREGLRKKSYLIHQPRESAGAFVNFSTEDPKQLVQATERLKGAKISFALRGPGIRLSPHAFNTDQEIDFALSIL